jgi:hypothetical protein
MRRVGATCKTKKADVSVPLLGSNTSAYSLTSRPDEPGCCSFNLPKIASDILSSETGKEHRLAEKLRSPVTRNEHLVRLRHGQIRLENDDFRRKKTPPRVEIIELR